MKVKKVLMSREGDTFYVNDDSKDYHMEFGVVKKEDMKGNVTNSNAKHKTLFVVDADFIDNYRRIKRTAQIMIPKDIAMILAETGIGPGSVIIEAGSGSGAAGCFLARYVKHVYSYEIKQEHHDTAKENAEMLGIKNITLYNQDILEGAKENGADLFLLDVPEPWTILDVASSALKRGGYLVCYNPTILQIADNVNAVEKREDFIYLKSVEVIEREWHVKGKSVRPDMHGLSHTGFLSFFRKVSPQ